MYFHSAKLTNDTSTSKHQCVHFSLQQQLTQICDLTVTQTLTPDLQNLICSSVPSTTTSSNVWWNCVLCLKCCILVFFRRKSVQCVLHADNSKTTTCLKKGHGNSVMGDITAEWGFRSDHVSRAENERAERKTGAEWAEKSDEQQAGVTATLNLTFKINQCLAKFRPLVYTISC